MLPLLHPHGVGRQRRQLRGQRGEFMVVRGEQRAAAIGFVQMLDAARQAGGDAVDAHQRRVADELGDVLCDAHAGPPGGFPL